MKAFSIKIKFTMIAMLICLVSFGVAAFFSTKWLREEIHDDQDERASLIGTHIIHDIESSMGSKNHKEIQDVFDIYRNYKNVEEVRFFNLKGDEVPSKVMNPSEAGVKETLATGRSVHFNKEINGKEVESYIIPIMNKPECHACHGKSEAVRGAVLLSLNTEGMANYIGQQEHKFFILFGLIAAGTIFATVMALKRFFLNPLTALREGAEAIEKGDFGHQIPVRSKDEVGTLAEHFNTMAQTLQRYFKEKKEDEMRLIMSERLAALGEMASGIAHEINNPLATIAACTEALLNRMEKEKMGSILFESYLRIIQDEINRCENITNSMLSFVKKRDGGKQDVEINEVLDKTLEMVNFQGRLKDVDVVRQYQEEIPVIHNNEGDLRQVFHSIIANAADAMDGKGALVIETGTTGNSISIKISDTGPGIPPHLISRIFDPFFTTKSEKGGTGLGLSIADKIIKENNGKIDVISEEGKGTTFTITLPI